MRAPLTSSLIAHCRVHIPPLSPHSLAAACSAAPLVAVCAWCAAVVLLGEGRVGKTCLCLRYVNNTFSSEQESTIQATYLEKRLNVGRRAVTLNIWDTAGQERFHALGPIYYRDSHGAVLVYDITDRDSFTKVRHWVKELRKIVGPAIVLVIAGNKADMPPQVTQPRHTNTHHTRHAMHGRTAISPATQPTAASSPRAPTLCAYQSPRMICHHQPSSHAAHFHELNSPTSHMHCSSLSSVQLTLCEATSLDSLGPCACPCCLCAVAASSSGRAGGNRVRADCERRACAGVGQDGQGSGAGVPHAHAAHAERPCGLSRQRLSCCDWWQGRRRSGSVGRQGRVCEQRWQWQRSSGRPTGRLAVR